MIVSIGNAPSSGSTLLGDILDGYPRVMCGPETALLSLPALYEQRGYARLRARGSRRFRSSTASVYGGYRGRIVAENLYALGLSAEILDRYVRVADDLPGLLDAVADHVRVLRSRPDAVWIEKTPRNIHTAQRFLESVHDGHFVHLVRDPAAVIASLGRRGFAPYIASATWLIAEASVTDAVRAHPHYHRVRYEDLVADPYGEVSALLSRIGLGEIDPGALAHGHRTNRYRELTVDRIRSWSTNESRDVAASTTRPTVDRERLLASVSRTMVDPDFAARQGLSVVSFSDVAHSHGYDVPAPAGPAPTVHVDLRSAARLAAKWCLDHVQDGPGPAPIAAALRPVVER